MALEAIKEQKTLNQIATEFKVHPNQVTLWKKEMLSKLPHLFEKTFETTVNEEAPKLYEEIGRLKMENTFLKKNFRILD